MEIGFNNDVVYRGATFHIQTEDHGGDDMRVSTQLFRSGQILDSKTVSYAHLLEGLTDDEARKNKIRKVMVGAHRALYKKLFNGDYDDSLGDAIDKSSEPEGPDPEEFEPAQERVPEAVMDAARGASVIEEDGKVTFTFDHGDMVDLNELSQQLSQLDVFPEGDGAVDLFGGFGQETAAAPPPQPAAVVAAPMPVKVTYEPTGRRAFQGLIEPAPDMGVLAMVRDFLGQT